MQTSTLRIESRFHDQLIEYLKKELSTKYTYNEGATTLLAGEEFRFRSSSYQMHLVVVKNGPSQCSIELVCGGGGTGIFNISWGSEKAFIKRTTRIIGEFCSQHGTRIITN